MAIEIITPQLGTIKKSTKDLIISTLMYDHPLNLTKLTNAIKKKFQASVTFQGVRKAVNQLVENGVIIKNAREYDLSRDWILELRNFVEKLQESHFTERTGIKDIQAIGDDIKVYTFDNLIDLDKFWDKLVAKWFEDDKDNKTEKCYTQLSGHAWYVLGQLGEETEIMEKIKRFNIKFYILANGCTFLDEWSKKYYVDHGFFYITNRDKKKNSNAQYFSVYNNYVIQITYPEEITKKIDSIYNNTKDFESFEAAKLIKILREKTDLKLTVMRNPVVAQQLRSFVLDKFNVKK